MERSFGACQGNCACWKCDVREGPSSKEQERMNGPKGWVEEGWWTLTARCEGWCETSWMIFDLALRLEEARVWGCG